MTGSWIGIGIEIVVAVLLAITIAYCILLNARLKRLKADEGQLRAVIGELVRATDAAERSIGGLRDAALECDKTLAKRIREAEFFTVEIAREIGEGQQVLDRIMQITRTARSSGSASAPTTAGPASSPPSVEVAPPSAEDVAGRTAPRMSDLKAKFAQSAERLSNIRRGLDGRAA